MKAWELAREIDNEKVKFIVHMPDEKDRVIDLKVVEVMQSDHIEGGILVTMKAK